MWQMPQPPNSRQLIKRMLPPFNFKCIEAWLTHGGKMVPMEWNNRRRGQILRRHYQHRPVDRRIPRRRHSTSTRTKFQQFTPGIFNHTVEPSAKTERNCIDNKTILQKCTVALGQRINSGVKGFRGNNQSAHLNALLAASVLMQTNALRWAFENTQQLSGYGTYRLIQISNK